MARAVELRGSRELRAQLKLLGARADAVVGAALYVEAEQIITASVPLVPVDESTLRASKFVAPPKLTARGPEVTFGYGGAATGYALYLHEGTGPAVGKPPFMPPVSAFVGWARRVLGDESLAFVVARAVGRRGLRPLKYLETPLRQRARGMSARIGRRVAQALERGT